MPNLFPYTNTHELNLDWILQVVKDFQTKYTTFDQALADALAAIEAGKVEALDEISTDLTAALNDIEASHAAALTAIGNTKDSALADIGTALTNATNAISALNTTVQGEITTLKNTSISEITTAQGTAISAITASMNHATTIIEQLYNTLPASAQDILGKLDLLDNIITGNTPESFTWLQGSYVYPEGSTPPTPPAIWTESPTYNQAVSSRYMTGVGGRRIRIKTDGTIYMTWILKWTNTPPGGGAGAYVPGQASWFTNTYADILLPLDVTAFSIELAKPNPADTIAPTDIPGHIEIQWITDFVSQRIIAPKESSTTADVARLTGEYFFLDGDLYIATDDIDIGDTIEEGTNCEKKTVGGELSDLKSAIDDFTDQVSTYETIYSANMIPPDSEQGYWDVTTGGAVNVAGYSRSPGFIDVKSGKIVYISSDNWSSNQVYLLEFVDENSAPIKYNNFSSNSAVSLRDTTKKIKIYINGTSLTIPHVCISYTSSTYVAYSVSKNYTLKYDALPDEIIALDTNSKETISTDYTPLNVYSGRYILLSGTNVFLAELSGFKVTEYLVKANQIYKISGSGNTNSQNKLYVTTTIANRIPTPTGTYGTSKPYSEYGTLTNVTQTDTFEPDEDCYVYVQTRDSEGVVANIYGPMEMLKTDVIARRTDYLNGKKIVNFGDSLFGNFRNDFGEFKSISAMIRDMTGATVYNAGFGGCQMAERGDDTWDAFSMYDLADAITTNDWDKQDAAITAGSGSLPTYFTNTLALLKEITTIGWTGIDIITIGYGTNDFTNNTTQANFKAALDHAIETILTTYPHLKIYVVSPMFRWWGADDGSDTHTNGISATLVDYVGWCKAESDKYHVGYIDTYTNLGINLINRLQYFAATDGTHPNAKGRYLRAYKMVGVMQNE